MAGGTIDFPRSRFVPTSGTATRLSARQSQLLAYLSDYANQTVSRDQLLVQVWGHSDLSLSRAVDTAVARLRRKIEPCPAHPETLFTDHGEGYRLLVPQALSQCDARADPPAAQSAPFPRRILRLGTRHADLSAGYVLNTDDGRRTALTGQERRVLEELLRVRGAAIERSPLARRTGIASAGAVRSTIHRLRQKLESDPGSPRYLLSVPGGSYRLEARITTQPVAAQARMAALLSLADHLGAVLGFSDCVLYLRRGSAATQVAAFGAKRNTEGGVHQPMTQALGEGIVGTVMRDDQSLCIADCRDDPRYLPDAATLVPARSEVAVPVRFAGQVVGVIDSEHPQPNAYGQQHQNTLLSMATIAAPAFAQLQEGEHGDF